MSKRVKLASDIDVITYAVKQILYTEYNKVHDTRAVSCIFNAGITRGKTILCASLYSADHVKLVEYAVASDSLLQAMYDVKDAHLRKEYK